MKQFFQGRGFQVAALMLAAFLVLIVNREFGVADNGDFGRYMGEFASIPVGSTEEKPAVYSREWQYRYFQQPVFYWNSPGSTFSEPWFTSAILFWRAGEVLGKYLFSADVVNLRYIGLPLFLLHFLALALLVRRVPPSAAGPSLLLLGAFLIMTDARTTAFYNSFYAESVSFAALFLVFAFLASHVWSGHAVPWRGWKESVICSAVLAILVAAMFAKRQYLYFIGPALVLVYYYAKAGVRLSGVKCAVVVGVGAVALACVAGALTTAKRIDNPEELLASRFTSFHALYYGLLPHSKKQSQVLEALGLPATSIALIGKSAWHPDTGKFVAEHPEITIKTFLKAIVLDPRAFLGSLWQNAKEVGNFDTALGMIHGDKAKYPPLLVSAFAAGSTKVAGAGIFVLSILLAGILAVFPAGASPEGRFASRILCVTLLVIIVADVAISTFDGRQEARKHVMVASLAAALMLVHAASSWAAHWAHRRRQRLEIA